MAGLPETAELPRGRRLPRYYVLKVLRHTATMDPLLVTVVPAGPYLNYEAAWHAAGLFRADDPSGIYIAGEMCSQTILTP